MKRTCIIVITFSFLVSLACYAQDWGILKCVDCTVNVRAERSIDSRVVTRLKPGDIVKVDFLDGSWWAVFRAFEKERSEEYAIGYVYAPLLKPISSKTMRVWPEQPERKQ